MTLVISTVASLVLHAHSHDIACTTFLDIAVECASIIAQSTTTLIRARLRFCLSREVAHLSHSIARQTNCLSSHSRL